MKKLHLGFMGAVALIASVVGLESSKAATTMEIESVNSLSTANSSLAGDSVIVTDRNMKIENLVLLSEPMDGINIVSYLKKNIRYPDSAIEKGIEGYVKIFCTLEKNGEVTNVLALEGNDEELSYEVIKLLRKAKFQPVLQNNVPAKINMIIPVNFDISEKRL